MRTVTTFLLEVVSVISTALVYDMVAIVRSSTDAHALISEGPEDVSSWDQARAHVAFQDLDSMLSMYLVDDGPFQAFIERLGGWLQALPELEDASSSQLAADAMRKALDNSKACAQVDGVLRSMARFLASDSLAAGDLVAEFTRETDPVLQAASRLPLAARLRSDMDALRQVSFHMAEDESRVVEMTLDMGDGAQRFFLSAADADSLLQQLPGMAVYELIGNLFSDATDVVLLGVAQGVSLSKLRAPQGHSC